MARRSGAPVLARRRRRVSLITNGCDLHLRARGETPGGFLSCCAQLSRGWLRITSAYEFRHREVLDHLAPAEAPRR
jgi:hypothetical protein